MSSTDATMAPAAVQPSMRVLSAEPVSRAGDAAGEPVVAVVTPVSALPPPAFQMALAQFAGIRRIPEMHENLTRRLLS
jgi:hypothetical protein